MTNPSSSTVSGLLHRATGGALALWRSPAGVVLLHLFLLSALTSALYCFGVIRYLPANEWLGSWDVVWYEQIARQGYTYSATQTSSVAFFPFFPYWWRLTHLDRLGISLVNAALFLSSFAWLAQQLALPRRWQLLALSTPLLLFMWVPYTEAWFFVFSSLLLAGLHRGRTAWVLAGLLGAGLVRSAGSLFGPALLLTVLVLALSGQRQRAWRWGVGGLLALATSVGIVATTLQVQTGEPWGFIKAHRHWGHVLAWPTWPMQASTGINMLWLEAFTLALAVGGAALALGWLRRVRQHWATRTALAYPSPAVVFAVGYTIAAALFIVFFQKGNVANLARYVLASPFFVVLLWQTSRWPRWPARTYAVAAAGAAVLWMVFGAYTHFENFTLPQTVWYFGLLTTYLLLYAAWPHLRYGREILVLLYVFNLVVQLHLLDSFLQYYLVE